MKALIVKYLTETISETEKHRLLDWLRSPKNQKIFKEFVKINHRLQKVSTTVDAEEAYKKLMAALVDEEREKVPTRKIFPNWLKYTAVFVGVALIGFGMHYYSPKKNAPMAAPQITLQLDDGGIRILNEESTLEIVDAQGRLVSNQKQNQLVYTGGGDAQKLEYNILTVPYGKTFQLKLADGSHVVLNAGTKLKYPVSFLGENRTVFLNGEAYFEVAEDPEHPFIVSTEDMDIEMLGTQFNVTSYPDDQKTYAVLVEGKVAAHSNLTYEVKTLVPNEKVFFENGSLQVQSVKVAKYVAWVQGQLVFVDDPFSIIKNKLERKYNVKIVNNYAELAKITITATFTDETIEEVLKTFQTYKDFTYTLKDGPVFSKCRPLLATGRAIACPSQQMGYP